MEIQSNIPDLIKRLETFKQRLTSGEINVTDAMTGALKVGSALMKRRIFNLGQDATGETLGVYIGHAGKVTSKKFTKLKGDVFDIRDIKNQRKALTKFQKTNPGQDLTEYEKYRVSLGHQIQYKDLEVTGSLRRSIDVVIAGNDRVVVAIVNDLMAKIANGQEEQVGRIRALGGPAKIFIFSEAEFEQTKNQGNELIKQVLSKEL